MGSRGPVPKRSDQRRRTNQDEGPITKAPAGRTTGRGTRRPAVRAADAGWHPLIQDLYNDIRKSGQSAFYEPSDYAMLRIGCEIMSGQLLSDRVSAVMFASWDALMARLLVTEGDRRRMRMELEREKPENPDADAGVAQMDAWRTKLAGAK
jgi:hypothetical protein